MLKVTDQRLEMAIRWVKGHLGDDCRVLPLAGDASFRRYFRVVQDERSYVLMDAPPEKEDVAPFLAVRAWLSSAEVRVPDLIAEDRQQGFLLLQDFGDLTWASHLAASTAPEQTVLDLFADALAQLTTLQRSIPPMTLPRFDIDRMQRECDLYLDWYLPKVAGYQPSLNERENFHASMLPLLQQLAALPQTPVHLDYHSRNLMLPVGRVPLGVIDFQDAVLGPVTYDLASLLYDCYQNYPESIRRQQSRLYFDQLPSDIRSEFEDFKAWHHALRLTALQRHIKAIGIFARLAYRDGKQQFLGEIPLTRIHLVEEVAALDLNAPGLSMLQIEPEDGRNDSL